MDEDTEIIIDDDYITLSYHLPQTAVTLCIHARDGGWTLNDILRVVREDLNEMGLPKDTYIYGVKNDGHWITVSLARVYNAGSFGPNIPDANQGFMDYFDALALIATMENQT